jgi:hypothetical protein
MPQATFDGDTLTIQLPSIGSYNVESEIYSAWKEWVLLGDNAKYPIAFDTTGGDVISDGQKIASYFFCRNDNGWRIQAPPSNGEVVVKGNLFPKSALDPMYVENAGFDAFIRQESSTSAVVVETGASGLTPAESSQLSLINTVQSLVNELHKVRGLNLATPVTFTTTAITVDDIALSVTGDGINTSTVTRDA